MNRKRKIASAGRTGSVSKKSIAEAIIRATERMSKRFAKKRLAKLGLESESGPEPDYTSKAE